MLNHSLCREPIALLADCKGSQKGIYSLPVSLLISALNGFLGLVPMDGVAWMHLALCLQMGDEVLRFCSTICVKMDFGDLATIMIYNVK